MGKRFYIFLITFIVIGVVAIGIFLGFNTIKEKLSNNSDIGSLPTYFNRYNQNDKIEDIDSTSVVSDYFKLSYSGNIISIPTPITRDKIHSNYRNELFDVSGEFYIILRNANQKEIKRDVALDDNSRVLSFKLSGIKSDLVMQIHCFSTNVFSFYNNLDLKEFNYVDALTFNLFGEDYSKLSLKEAPKTPFVLSSEDSNYYKDNYFTDTVIRTPEDLANEYFNMFNNLGYYLENYFYSEYLIYLNFGNVKVYAQQIGYKQYSIIIER